MAGRGQARVVGALETLDLPDAVFRTCPWEPRSLIVTGLNQWLRCCAARRGGQVLGMPSRAVDEAWHGFILCTRLYSQFCRRAYGRYLHHHPVGVTPAGMAGEPADAQLHRTVAAWAQVARPGEICVLWDLDERLGVDEPWGVDPAVVAALQITARRVPWRPWPT